MDSEPGSLSPKSGNSDNWKILVALIGLGGILFFAATAYFFNGKISQEISPSSDATFASFINTTFPTDARIRNAKNERVEIAKVFDKTPNSSFIINMWASWCEPCVHELPDIVKATPKLRERGIEVLLVNYDGANAEKILQEIPDWLKAKKFDLVTWFDFDNELTNRLKIGGLPVSIAIGPDKKIRWVRMGEINWLDDKQTQVVQ